MPDQRLQQIAALEGAIHVASNEVHAITGRTDQHITDIVALYPDHSAVINYRKAVEARKNFVFKDDAQ